MRRVPWFVAALGSAVLAATATAEKVDMPPEALFRTATHVVTGRVTAIYRRAVTRGGSTYTHYLAEIRVATSEKGDGIKPGDLVYVRYYQLTERGKDADPFESRGHRGLPKEGDDIRVYLARNAYDGFSRDNDDGGFNVIGANGFQPIKRAPGG